MKKLILILGGVLVFFSCVGLIPIMLNSGQTPPTRQADPAPAKKSKRPAGLDVSEAMQAERKRFIEKQISAGLWTKSEFTGSLPKVWLTDSFLSQDRATQNQLLEVAYTYWMGELDDFGQVSDLIWDSLVLKTEDGTPLGDRVGTYDPANGFKPGS